MNLKIFIPERHSKENTAKAVALIGINKQLFGELISFIFSENRRLAPRAAWIASEVSRLHPELIKPHIKDLVNYIQNKNTDYAVKRNTLRILQFVTIPPALHGALMNVCFEIIISGKEPPAVKANALTILDNLSERYPGIRDELKMVIESGFETESPAFKSRASKILKKLSIR
ncbi:hypothetical protein [Flavitalea sp.]|nr:hypothetical protein [Flavitalea sp.]